MRLTLILTAALVLLAPTGAARAAGENDPYRDDGSIRFRFYTGGELLYMERDGTPDVEVSHNIRSQFMGPDIITEAIGTDDVIDDDEEFGGRIFLGMRLNRSSSVEAVYMGWGHSRSTTAFSPFQDLNAFEFPDAVGPAFPDGSFDDAAIHDLEFDSEFHSGEINYRHAVQVDGADYRFNLLAGLRGIRLEDNLAFTSWDSYFGAPPPAAQIGTYDISTRNTLIGAQVGVETFVPLWEDRLDLDLYFVVGGYANQTNIYVDSFDGNTGVEGRNSELDWEPSAVIESAIHLNVRLWRGVKMTLGYRVVYIDGIAAAAEQFPRSGSPGDTNKNFSNSTDTVFHGASVGLGVDF